MLHCVRLALKHLIQWSSDGKSLDNGTAFIYCWADGFDFGPTLKHPWVFCDFFAREDALFDKWRALCEYRMLFEVREIIYTHLK